MTHLEFVKHIKIGTVFKVMYKLDKKTFTCRVDMVGRDKYSYNWVSDSESLHKGHDTYNLAVEEPMWEFSLVGNPWSRLDACMENLVGAEDEQHD